MCSGHHGFSAIMGQLAAALLYLGMHAGWLKDVIG